MFPLSWGPQPIEVLASGHMHVLDQKDSSNNAKQARFSPVLKCIRAKSELTLFRAPCCCWSQLARAWLDVLQLADDKARLEGVDVIFTEPQVEDKQEEGERKKNGGEGQRAGAEAEVSEVASRLRRREGQGRRTADPPSHRWRSPLQNQADGAQAAGEAGEADPAV